LESTIELQSSGLSDDLISLAGWLRRERILQGHVQLRRRPMDDVELGAAFDLIAVAIGSGGAATVLAGSLSTWLQHRSKVSIKITKDGQTLEIEARNIQNAQDLIQRFLDDGNDISGQ
jgi:hypothetical protein